MVEIRGVVLWWGFIVFKLESSWFNFYYRYFWIFGKCMSLMLLFYIIESIFFLRYMGIFLVKKEVLKEKGKL